MPSCCSGCSLLLASVIPFIDGFNHTCPVINNRFCVVRPGHLLRKWSAACHKDLCLDQFCLSSTLVESHGLSPHLYADDVQVYGSCSPAAVDASQRRSPTVPTTLRTGRGQTGWCWVRINPRSSGAQQVGVSTNYQLLRYRWYRSLASRSPGAVRLWSLHLHRRRPLDVGARQSNSVAVLRCSPSIAPADPPSGADSHVPDTRSSPSALATRLL